MAKCMLIINNHLSYNLTIGAIEAHRTAWSPYTCMLVRKVRTCYTNPFIIID